jgi:hypothetical protein
MSFFIQYIIRECLTYSFRLSQVRELGLESRLFITASAAKKVIVGIGESSGVIVGCELFGIVSKESLLASEEIISRWLSRWVLDIGLR